MRRALVGGGMDSMLADAIQPSCRFESGGRDGRGGALSLWKIRVASVVDDFSRSRAQVHVRGSETRGRYIERTSDVAQKSIDGALSAVYYNRARIPCDYP